MVTACQYMQIHETTCFFPSLPCAANQNLPFCFALPPSPSSRRRRCHAQPPPRTSPPPEQGIFLFLVKCILGNVLSYYILDMYLGNLFMYYI
jgi:hypothetical protein